MNRYRRSCVWSLRVSQLSEQAGGDAIRRRAAEKPFCPMVCFFQKPIADFELDDDLENHEDFSRSSQTLSQES